MKKTITRTDTWYQLKDEDQTDSPALLIYPERIRHNIREMIRIAGDPARLVPHVKTHKMSGVIRLQLSEGINRFKCATIAEAEMVADAGGKDILVAYQLNPTKAGRFLGLIKAYPNIRFASLVDNTASARMLSDLYADAGLEGSVFIDVDNGMHRTGFPASGDLAGFYREIAALDHILCRGFHVYDGHIHEHDFTKRRAHCEKDMQPVRETMATLKSEGIKDLDVIAGGSPTFPIHAEDPELSCSPGTSLLWDWGYGELLSEQPFIPAAVLLTRIISSTIAGQITTDLGHKSVAAENPISRRIAFLNLENYEVSSQSEEHLVVKLDEAAGSKLAVGAALYGIPYHICPSVALYDQAQVVEDGRVTAQWDIEGRRRRNRF